MGKYNRAKFTKITIERDVKSELAKECRVGESYSQAIARLLHLKKN